VITLESPVITSVVCTRGDRPALLEKCLKSLMYQNISMELYEILLVDNSNNGSARKTAEKIRQNKIGNRLRYVHEPIPGLSRARNCGWKHARGTHVGYVDDDAVASETWVASAIAAFSSKKIQPAWAGGPIYLEWEKPRPSWINDEMCVPLGRVYWGEKPRILTHDQRLGGGNSIFEKNVLEDSGGFNESLGRIGNKLLSGEETQLQKKIESNGGILYYHPGISIRHFVPADRLIPSWFYRRYYWGGVSDRIMERTFDEKVKSRIETVREKEPQGERLIRFSKNVFNAFHFMGPKEEQIWARVYLSYCLGYIVSSFLYKAEKTRNLFHSR